MIVKVYRPDGSFYEIDAPEIVVPVKEVEPTTEDILNAMLGVN